MRHTWQNDFNLIPLLVLFVAMLTAYWWLGRKIDPISGKCRSKTNGAGWLTVCAFCLVNLVVGVVLVWGGQGPTLLDRWQETRRNMKPIVPGRLIGR